MKSVPYVYINFEGDDAGTGQKVVFFVASVMHLRQMTLESKIMIRGLRRAGFKKTRVF